MTLAIIRNLAFVSCFVALMITNVANAQTIVAPEIRLGGKSDGSVGSVQLAVSSSTDGSTSNQTITFPASAGTQGQVLVVTASDGSATLGWTTPINGKIDTTSYLQDTLIAPATEIADNTSWGTGVRFVVGANKFYQFIAYIRIRREAAGGSAANDDIILAFNRGSSTSTFTYGVECLTCDPATSSITNGFIYRQTSINNTQVAIAPAGDTEGVVHTYVLNGVIDVGTTGGLIIFSFNKSGGSETAFMQGSSYVVAREIP
jgi:hypothetical protein